MWYLIGSSITLIWLIFLNGATHEECKDIPFGFTLTITIIAALLWPIYWLFEFFFIIYKLGQFSGK